MDIFDLQAKIGINTTEYKKGITEASKSFSDFGTKVKDGAAKLAKLSAGALAAVAGAATATTAAILKGVDAYTTYGDNVDKMSQKLNMSAQAYQEWSAIMEHSGTSIDSMQASMKTLANAVESGNDAFDRLGITQEEIASLNNEQLFSRTITALQNVDNETERTYLAGQLLGRGATELGALLNTSAEDTEKMRQRVHELGGVMSDEAVKASAKYKDSIQDMKTAFKGMGRDLISDFVPALTTVSDGLAAIFSGDENGAELFTKGFNNALATLSNSTSKLKPVIKKIASIAAEVVPQIIGTVSEGILSAAPVWLDYGKNALKNIAEGLSNADFDVNNNVFTKLLSSIVGNSADYFKYAQQILSNLANRLLDVDYGALASNISTVFVNAINSMTDFVKSIDFYKVGENIANFLNGIDWQQVANSIFDLLAAGIKGLGNIAVSFFANADLGNLMTMIGLLSAPKLLGGITDFAGGEEGQALGKAAGQSWSGAFMAGVKAFGLGWALGSYIRDELVENYGEEKVNDVIGGGAFGVLGLSQEMKIAQEKANSYTYTNRYGQKVTIPMYDEHANYTEAYKKVAMQGPKLPDFIGPKKPENNAIGNYITQPTLTWAAEKEPEYIIPESKMDKVFSREGVTININVSGADLVASDTVAQKIAETLANLSIRQQRAVGGTAW